MVRYNLPSNPNFTISVVPEGLTYVMTFKYIRGLMYVTIFDDFGTRLAGPLRVCEGEWLIPVKAYNMEGAGNFTIVEATEQYPMFDIFNSSCELRYYTLDEINAGVDLHE